MGVIALVVPLRTIEMMSEDEKQLHLITFNETLAEFPQQETLQQLFEEQAKEFRMQLRLPLGTRV